MASGPEVPNAYPWRMKHFLIVYHRLSGTIRELREYGAGRGQVAIHDRFLLEREHRNAPDVEVVVLGADSLETLKRTHGRYFANSTL